MASSSSADPAHDPRRRPRRRLVAAAAALLILVVGSVTAVVLGRPEGGDDTPRHRATDKSFSVAVPAGWRALSDRQLDDIPTTPAAVLRRVDRRGHLP